MKILPDADATVIHNYCTVHSDNCSGHAYEDCSYPDVGNSDKTDNYKAQDTFWPVVPALFPAG